MQPATKPSENKVGWPQMHLGKVTILHISLRSIAEYFAKNSLRSFGKNFCKQFASLIWQKESLYRANFATFASLNICKIILNVRSAHYLQINLCTLAMLAHKLGPSLGFFGGLTLFYFGLLWQVGCRYTYSGSLSWWIAIWVICPWNKFEEKAQFDSVVCQLTCVSHRNISEFLCLQSFL